MWQYNKAKPIYIRVMYLQTVQVQGYCSKQNDSDSVLIFYKQTMKSYVSYATLRAWQPAGEMKNDYRITSK